MNKLEKIKEMLQNKPGDSFLRFALAKEYEGLDDWESAINHYEELVQEDPDYTGVYYHLAHAYIEVDDHEKAEKCFKMGIERCEKNKDLHALAELKNAYMNFEMGL